MPTPISYLSGNTLSYQSGMVKKATIGLNLTSSLTGNYRWWNGVEVTSSQYLIYSDTYSTGASNESNVTPAAWSTPDLTDTSLLNLINTLPDRVGQTPFTTLSNALIWLNESGKYFVVRNGYDNIVTSGLTLNLDAAWNNSYATGTTTWNDLSGSGNTFTLINGVGFNTSDSGSLTFDGTDDYTKTTSSFMNGATQGTFEFWFQTSSISGGGSYYFHRNCLIGKASGPDNGLGFSTTSNRLRLRLGADSNLDSTIELNTNVIYHVVGTWDSGGSKIYINGVLNNSNNTSNLSWYSSGFETIIGRVYVGAAGASFTGKIYSARAYNRALSQSEILQNYHVTKQRFGFNNIVGTGLVLNLNSQNTISYPITGTSWYDLSGNNNTGTLTNGPTFNSTERSLVFDGTDDYVVTSTNTGISGNNPWTMEITINVNSSEIGGGRKGWMMWEGPNSQSTNTLLSAGVNSGYVEVAHWANDTVYYNSPITFDKWQHIVITYLNNVENIYINGVNTNTKTVGPLSIVESEWYLASRSTSDNETRLNCKISDFKIYNKQLSTSEVLQNYYQGNIVTNGLIMNLDAGNLVSYGGTGTIWNDLTNTTTGATLVNGPTYTTSNGGGIVFDGSDDYGRLPSTSSVDVNTFTWSAFVKGVYSNTPGLFFIGSDVGQSISPYKIFIGVQNAGGVYKLRVNYNNVATVNLGSLVDNTLYNLVITYNGTTTNMYVNGELIGTSNAMSGNLTSKTYTYIASTQGVTEFFNGTVYNTLFYNRALSQSEIIQNFNAHKSRYGL